MPLFRFITPLSLCRETPEVVDIAGFSGPYNALVF
jgi:hypothetical protein